MEKAWKIELVLYTHRVEGVPRCGLSCSRDGLAKMTKTACFNEYTLTCKVHNTL